MSNTVRRSTKSLQFKLTIGYVLVLATLVLTIAIVLQTRLRSQLEEASLRQIDAKGELIVAEMVRRLALINTLTESMANFSANAEHDQALFNTILPSLIDLAEHKALIAGGGYWPEPYQFDTDTERRSFFWGRDDSGRLSYFDDYNRADGGGYHNEEWYVPAKYLQPGRCYWSRSYIDPYSSQPMVTCTVAVLKDSIYTGATTIDLKLEGIAEFLNQQTANTKGYAFIVDQNNKFITFPDSQMVRSENGQDHILASQLGSRDPNFKVLAQELETLSSKVVNQARQQQEFDNTIVQQLANASYQINPEQALVIASVLVDPKSYNTGDSKLLSRIHLVDDLLLGEAVTASIFYVPDAYWKLVVVTPQAQALLPVTRIITDTLQQTLLPLLLIMAIGFICMRQLVIKPIRGITTNLKKTAGNGKFYGQPLDEKRSDEFGQLAYWYNLRTRELAEAMDKLSLLNQELSYQASYDNLTNMLNRREFEKRLTLLMESEQAENFALMYMDVDQFKVINDTCGHHAGDQLLVTISEHIRQITRDTDIAARIGGDEFAFLIRTADREMVEQVAERIRHELESISFNWNKKSFNISCSIGVVRLADVEHDASTALRQVDNACYAAKDRGRNRVHFYQPDDDFLSHREGEMNWVTRINEALDYDRFSIDYQIIAPTSNPDKTHTAIEALVRMQNLDGSISPPGAFLPAAERYNRITRIDQWMVDHVMADLLANPDVLHDIQFCSINLSADSICDEEFPDYVRDKIYQYDFPIEKLCFEVTETQVMNSMISAKNTLQQLRNLGAKIALDDFGSGMSSYGYLRELPVDLLKIDGGFVRDMKDDNVHLTFVKSINDIANVMGLLTVAEFVEDPETFELLKDIGVAYAQGYSIAKPQPIAEIYLYFQKNK